MNKRSRFWSILSKTLIGLALLFFYLPIFYIIVFSFNGKRSLTGLDGFSLQWYEKMFNDPTMMSSIWYTIIIAVISTIVATIFGTITAIGLSKSGKFLRKATERVNELPVMNPDIVTAISLLMLFSALAVTKGFVTMLLAHIMFCTPFVILSIMPKLRTLDPNLTDAALDLGCTPFQTMTKVIIPQIKPSIIAGALIAFTMSFDDFVISYFVTGNGVQNISILVYTMSKRINPSINALRLFAARRLNRNRRSRYFVDIFSVSRQWRIDANGQRERWGSDAMKCAQRRRIGRQNATRIEPSRRAGEIAAPRRRIELLPPWAARAR